VAQKGAKIKRYAACGQLQPRFTAYAPDFLRDRRNRPDRTVALEPVPKKLRAFFDTEMLHRFDYELRPDQMVPFDRDAL
jgi:hypothetical protein